MVRINPNLRRGGVKKIHGPIVVEKIENLINKQKFSDVKIARLINARLIKNKGKFVSTSYVMRIRHKMGVKTLYPKFTRAKATEKQIISLQRGFKRLTKEEMVAKWKTLNRIKRIIKEKIDQEKDKKQRNKLIDELAKLNMQFEALFLLLPEEIQLADKDLRPTIEKAILISS